MTALWAWLAALVAGGLAALGGLAWWRHRKPAPVVRVDDAGREAEAVESRRVADVDAEAARKIEEARHGGAAALRDRVNNRR